jgi:hypothetical protein
MAVNGILCVWANLPDDALDWYENEYLPDMREQNAIHTLHCELTQSGFEGDPIGQLDSPWPLYAVYEVKEIRKATDACYDKRNHPSDDMLAGPLAQARFDTRTYRELKRWQSEEWDGGTVHLVNNICATNQHVRHVASRERDWNGMAGFTRDGRRSRALVQSLRGSQTIK